MSDYELGQHAADIATLKDQVSILGEKMDTVLAFVNKVDGAWKTGAVFLTTIAAVIGSLVTYAVDYLKGRHA